MISPPVISTQPDHLRTAVVATVCLAAGRIAVLFATPLELHPDEAQYWLWSRDLALGYYSKPPMIAWAIWTTTAVGGDAEPWVRLSATLFQAGAGLCAFLIGRRLFGAATGLAALALYSLMPGIQLSALIAATDAPLLFFLGLTILSYCALQDATGRRRMMLAAGCGAGLGLAFLSKYAAIYALIGLAMHLAASRQARSAWTPASAAAALLVLAALLGPNLLWNATHGFVTLRHTAENANWSAAHQIDFIRAAEFLGAQFGVFGPVPMGVLFAGAILAVVRRRLPAADLLLLCFTLPPLAIVLVQALVSRANANWSAAAYMTGAVLAAAWLMRWRARGWLIGGLGVQAVAAVLVLTCALSPALADRLGLGNGLKRVRGWAETTDLVLDRASREPGLTAIAVNNRLLFYAMSYYGRGRPETPPLRTWLLKDGPRNQAEVSAPLTRAYGDRALMVAYEGWRREEMQADFARVGGLEIASVGLDRTHRRRIEMFIGEGLSPRLRAPLNAPSTPP